MSSSPDPHRAGRTAGQTELIGQVQQHITMFQAPRAVDVVLELPRSSTGKIRKDLPRTPEGAGHESGIQG